MFTVQWSQLQRGSEMRELLGKAKSIKVTSFLSTVSTAICVLCIVNFHPLTKVLAISVTVPISSGNWLKTEDPALRSASTGLTANTRFLNAGTGKGFREA